MTCLILAVIREANEHHEWKFVLRADQGFA